MSLLKYTANGSHGGHGGSVDVKPGEFLQLDIFDSLQYFDERAHVEMVWLVDPRMDAVLEKSQFKSSADGHIWVSVRISLATEHFSLEYSV